GNYHSGAQNQTKVMEFILLGFPGSHYIQMFIFIIFLVMYTLTVLGNAVIIILVISNQHLHTLMYFFHYHLSFLEMWCTTASVPKDLAAILGYNKAISFTGCITQMFFVFILGSMLPTMLTFCGPNVINHFYCNIDSWIVVVCSSTYDVEMAAFVISIFVILGPRAVTLFSNIYSTILPSAKGQQKAFSICSSHLAVVNIWYGSTIFLYVKPSKWISLEITKLVNILSTVVTPLHNPFIFTLRNKEEKEAYTMLALNNVIVYKNRFQFK
uniref:G-protein coupled receptors family 1 profile domain-containing protein n=1 Tax=Laticauda laticaudata TaxID=8630 RepID=A0A8C5RCU4_LATLA